MGRGRWLDGFSMVETSVFLTTTFGSGSSKEVFVRGLYSRAGSLVVDDLRGYGR